MEEFNIKPEELEGSLSIDWFSKDSPAEDDLHGSRARYIANPKGPEAKSDKPEQANQLQSERPAEATELEEVNVKPEEPHSTIEIKRPVIHRSYPEIAAEILPALRESFNNIPREFINYYSTTLAQMAYFLHEDD